jgi:hypothetical protein
VNGNDSRVNVNVRASERRSGVHIDTVRVRRRDGGCRQNGAGHAERSDYWNEGDPADAHDSSCRFPAPA